MPAKRDQDIDFTVLDFSEHVVTLDGVDVPAWFDVRLVDEGWPTEIVVSVVVDPHQGPLLNGLRGGRSYAGRFEDVAQLLKDKAGDQAYLVKYLTAQAAGAFATHRVLDPRRADADRRAPGGRQSARVRLEAEVQRRRRVTRDLLTDVAEVYRSAYRSGDSPTVAVADHFDVSHSTAGRWVVAARKEGVLGAATGTKAGEADLSSE